MSHKPANILLVEDDPGHATLISRAFETHPQTMHVTVAQNMAEALNHLENSPPDLVISDLRLPDGDGIELLSYDSEHAPFPIVVMSSQGDEAVAVEIMKRGALDYIVKSEVTLQDMPKIAIRALREWQHIVERKHAENELKQRVDQLTLINDISSRITSILELDKVLDRTTRLIQETFGYHHVAILMIEDKQIKLKAISGSYKEFFPKEYTQQINEGIYGWVCTCGEMVLANNIQAEPRYISFIPEYSVTQAELCLPLKIGGKPAGILDIQSPHLNIFHKNDVLTLKILSGQIATAIENARLYEAVRQKLTEHEQTETAKTKLEDQLRHIQKMETVGTLTAGIAHDFNNLLTAINGFAEILQIRLSPNDPNKKSVDMILDSGQRAADLVSQLLAFSRKQMIQPQIINLNTIVENMNKMLQRIIGENINLKIFPGRNLWSVKVDKAQMEQVIVNIAVNARDAMPNGGSLVIETSNTVLDKHFVETHLGAVTGPHIRLIISDTGHGMSKEVQSHIFDPFFTTKKPGAGTGLGLSTVFGIVKQSNGNIWVSSKEDQGTTFEIYLPVEGKFKPSQLPVRKTDAPTGTETILLVEDDDGVRQLAYMILKSQGYQILEAKNAYQALKLTQNSSTPIDLLLTDVVMPKMNGKDLADMLTSIYPKMKVVFMSGYVDKALERYNISTTSVQFLKKPFNLELLANKVREILDTSHPNP